MPASYLRLIRLSAIVALCFSCLRPLCAEPVSRFEGDWISPKVLLRGLKITRTDDGLLIRYINHGNDLEYASPSLYSPRNESETMSMFIDTRTSLVISQGQAQQRINYIGKTDTLEISGFDYNNHSGNFMDYMSKAMMFGFYGISEDTVVMQRLTPELKSKARAIWKKIDKEESARKAIEEKKLAERLAQERKAQDSQTAEMKKEFVRTAIHTIVSSSAFTLTEVLEQTTVEEQLTMIRSASREDLQLFGRKEFKILSEGTAAEQQDPSHKKSATLRRAALLDRLGSKAVDLALMTATDFRAKAVQPGFVSSLSPADITYDVAVEIAAHFFEQVPEGSTLENAFEPENRLVKNMTRGTPTPEEALALKNLARRFGG